MGEFIHVVIEPGWMSVPGEMTQCAGEQGLGMSSRRPMVIGSEEEDGLASVWP